MSSPSQYGRCNRRAMTFVELLVAMALSLILIYGMAAAFGRVGEVTSDGRAKINMANQMRNVLNRVTLDLEGVTVPMRNWTSRGGGQGYFELIEGPRKEYTDIANPITEVRLFGDIDDAMMFTTRSADDPFRGRLTSSLDATGVPIPLGSPQVIEAALAEVIYAMTPIDAPLDVTSDPRDSYLYRRQLLIRPDLNTPHGYVYIATNTDLGVLNALYRQYITTNDLSVRVSLVNNGSDYTMRLIANSLEDLSARENRFAHRNRFLLSGTAITDNELAQTGVFPHTVFDLTPTASATYNAAFRTMLRSQHRLMSHVITFDLKLFDPTAPIYASASGAQAILPSDPGFYLASNAGANQVINPVDAATRISRGAFVDLGYGRSAFSNGLYTDTERLAVRSTFSDWPEYIPDNALAAPPTSTVDKSGLQFWAQMPRDTFVYDTWTDHYESNGLDENQNMLTDEGSDGIDNNDANGADEFVEKETAPPYGDPLRGIQLNLRMYESDTRQIRKMSLVNDFIPE